MENSLLVTLADKNYLDQAKQLFSSAYFNAGWKGDYMLLAHDVPHADLEWFRSKGIMIKQCQPLYSGDVGNMPAAVTSKFYLFTPEFKKWENIIYLDADMIVRASLNELTKVNGLAAAVDQSILWGQFFINSDLIDKNDQTILGQLNRKYVLKSKSFNSGVMAFNTELIEQGTFNSINQLMDEYKDIVKYGDQPILNLFFYKKWKSLPPAYNINITHGRTIWHLHSNKIKGIIIHSPGPDKLWLPNNYFYQEWKDSLDKADKIDLKNIPTEKKWTTQQIDNYSKYLNRRYIIFSLYYYIDRKIGLLGLLIKKYSPKFYKVLGGKNEK